MSIVQYPDLATRGRQKIEWVKDFMPTLTKIGEKEKIDIVTWSDNPSEYIREALSPAEINKVEIEDKKAKVFVSEDQQSIAIGKQGQNVRLASKLTGYEIDIELVKAAPKKKKQNVEDSLLSALEEASEE